MFNMAGFGQVVPHALPTEIEGGPTLPLAPLSLYALLKLVAFSDQDADVIGVIAREKGRILIEDEEREQIFEHFRWYRLGADL